MKARGEKIVPTSATQNEIGLGQPAAQLIPAQQAAPILPIAVSFNLFGFLSKGFKVLQNAYHEIQDIQDGKNIFTR